MSLRSDVMFVTSLIGKALRQILGETFRNLADYLLREGQEPETQPEAPKVEVAPAPVQSTPSRKKSTPKSKSRIEAAPVETPTIEEAPEKPVKVRDRSTYNPKEHNGYKIAALGVLRVLLSLDPGSKRSAPDFHKLDPISTDSTIRTACKTMVKDGILDTEYDNLARSNVYWVYNLDAAERHLAELEATAPELPTSDEPGEPQTSL